MTMGKNTYSWYSTEAGGIEEKTVQNLLVKDFRQVHMQQNLQLSQCILLGYPS